MGTSNTTTCATENRRACMRRVTVGIICALLLGIGFSALGGFMAGDFASINEDTEQTYLVTLPDDEDMLRTLSQQLMTSSEGGEASALSEIAPAAGAPLGTFGE